MNETEIHPWHEISQRYDRKDANGRPRTYVVLRCRCGTVWECRADNLRRMLSRECWHRTDQS